jgi:uncharacterized protein (TIGR01777 family)
MTGKRVVVAGASGLIGSGLCASLAARGDDVVQLVRAGSEADTSASVLEWNPRSGRLDLATLEGADAVVVLNGVPIGEKRWSDERKKLILTSRTDAVGTVARTIATMAESPPVLVAASAIGFYGDRGDELLDESSSRGTGFFSDVCTAWEQAARPASDAEVRVVNVRTGIVLSRRGGALKPMTPLFKFGIGGRIGDGRQWWSWVSDDDCVAAFEHCIDTEVSGPVNIVSPNPVTNSEFTKALGAALHRPTVLPVPRLALNVKLGSELAEAIGYVSHRVKPTALLESGFEFRHETIGEALSAALG